MPKIKTKKAVVKRFKKTANGKIKRTSAGGVHLLTGKSRKQKRSMGKTRLVSNADYKRIAVCIPN